MSSSGTKVPLAEDNKSWVRSVARILVLGWAIYWLYLGVSSLGPALMANGWQPIYLQPMVILGLILLPLLTVWWLEGLTVLVLLLEVVAGIYHFAIIDLLLSPLLSLADVWLIAGLFAPPLLTVILLLVSVRRRSLKPLEPIRKKSPEGSSGRSNEDPHGHDASSVAS